MRSDLIQVLADNLCVRGEQDYLVLASDKVDTSENPVVCERGLEVWARTARCDRCRARLPGGGWP